MKNGKIGLRSKIYGKNIPIAVVLKAMGTESNVVRRLADSRQRQQLVPILCPENQDRSSEEEVDQGVECVELHVQAVTQ